MALFCAIVFYPLETWALSIELSDSTIDFGEMNMGDIKDEVPIHGLNVMCTASPGTVGWTLRIKIEHPLTHVDNPASMIPNTNFKWYVVSTNDPNNIYAALYQRTEFMTYDQTVYVGNAGEEKTTIGMKFQLELPRAIQAGTYNTQYGKIVLTLTE